MLHRSLPPRFWLLIGCVVLPLINASNAILIAHLERDKFIIGRIVEHFIIFYVLSLIACFPFGLLSTIASEQWKQGSHRASRVICWLSGITSFSVFGYLLWYSWQKSAINTSNLTFASQFPLLMLWSFGLILTGFLLRTPQRT